MSSGMVFNIQRYSIQDGPGIRTTVFLKGCPLRCWWCHNPESQRTHSEILLNEQICTQCGECWDVCPQCDTIADRTHPHVARERCIRCGECVSACDTEARRMAGQSMHVDEVLEQVLQDQLFYDESGGGVTLSGGEPLLQATFAHDLLAAFRKAGLHTAVDTCGFGRRDDLLAMAPLTGLFLYDIKSLDDDQHHHATGVSNQVILDNLAALGRVHARIWIRVPVVPGLNDSREQLIATIRFAAQIDGVQQIHLLPYHELGQHKRFRLSEADGTSAPQPTNTERSVTRLATNPSPVGDLLEQLCDHFRDERISVQIGG